MNHSLYNIIIALDSWQTPYSVSVITMDMIVGIWILVGIVFPFLFFSSHQRHSRFPFLYITLLNKKVGIWTRKQKGEPLLSSNTWVSSRMSLTPFFWWLCRFLWSCQWMSLVNPSCLLLPMLFISPLFLASMAQFLSTNVTASVRMNMSLLTCTAATSLVSLTYVTRTVTREFCMTTIPPFVAQAAGFSPFPQLRTRLSEELAGSSMLTIVMLPRIAVLSSAGAMHSFILLLSRDLSLLPVQSAAKSEMAWIWARYNLSYSWNNPFSFYSWCLFEVSPFNVSRNGYGCLWT